MAKYTVLKLSIESLLQLWRWFGIVSDSISQVYNNEIDAYTPISLDSLSDYVKLFINLFQ